MNRKPKQYSLKIPQVLDMIKGATFNPMSDDAFEESYGFLHFAAEFSHATNEVADVGSALLVRCDAANEELAEVKQIEAWTKDGTLLCVIELCEGGKAGYVSPTDFGDY